MRRLIATISTFVTFALSLLVITVWFLAAATDGGLTLTVNSYGERWVEYLLWLVLTPTLVLGMHYTLRSLESPSRE
ncbi:hypothetical protein [Halosimplex halobium]|uniref:hypothetical protein n=1 Tax=Halosimplex halobium TaxID=3396618 RepID=UPI003F577D49